MIQITQWSDGKLYWTWRIHMIYIYILGIFFPVKTLWYALPPWTARRVLGSTCRRTPPKRNCRWAPFFSGWQTLRGGALCAGVGGKDGAVGSVGFVNLFQKEKMLHWSRRACTSCDRLIVDTTRFFDPGLYSMKSNCKLVQSRLLLLNYISHLGWEWFWKKSKSRLLEFPWNPTIVA